MFKNTSKFEWLLIALIVVVTLCTVGILIILHSFRPIG